MKQTKFQNENKEGVGLQPASCSLTKNNIKLTSNLYWYNLPI